jgi:hypothetical protein
MRLIDLESHEIPIERVIRIDVFAFPDQTVMRQRVASTQHFYERFARETGVRAIRRRVL